MAEEGISTLEPQTLDPQAFEPQAPQRSVKRKQKPKPKQQPRYNVILWDDDDHSYEYVILMVKKIFGFSISKGFKIAKMVDAQGRCICLTTTMEHAELKRDQIQSFGPDILIERSKGSMRASIEAVE